MLAILIDAENVQASFAPQIFECAAEYGPVDIKEIYGAATALTAWVEPTLKYAIHPNLTIRPSKFKNSSDIALVIGAMDMLLQNRASSAADETDTVIIASSDSDFSMLAVYLRQAGMQVIGMGTDKANPLWRTACTQFITLGQTGSSSRGEAKKQDAPKAEPKKQPEADKPVQRAEKPHQESPRQEMPKQEPKSESKMEPKPQTQPSSTHAGRIAVIRAFIIEQLGKTERVQASVLISALNSLPEYRTDQQRSRRKPLNYLLRHFGELFTTEESADGNTVYLRAAAPGEKAAKPAQEEKEQEEKEQEEKLAPAEKPEEVQVPAVEAPKAEAPRESRYVPAPEAPKAAEPASTQQAEDKQVILISQLELLPRPLNALQALGYTRADELERLSDQQLMSLKGIGKVAARQIREAIAKAKEDTAKKD